VLAVSNMALLQPLRQQLVNAAPDKLVVVVAKEGRSLLIRVPDYTGAVDDHHRIGRGLEHAER
jgi:hypothetical protein